MLRLTILSGARVRHVPVPEGARLRIGSSADNDVVLDDAGVSRHHATIERNGRGVHIVDHGSKNGIVLRARRVRNATLVAGEGVRLGAASLLVEEVATSDADLALRLDGESSATTRAVREDDTDTAADAGTGAAAALQWARRVETMTASEIARALPSLIHAARAIVRADCLLLAEADGEDLTVVAAAGPLPSGEEARELAQGSARSWIRCGRVAARLPQDARSAWKREFLDFVDTRLRARTGATGAAGRASESRLPPEMLIGSSVAMHALLAEIASVAHGTIDILVLGETGTGKELVARAIHLSSGRAKGPFVALNCAAVAKELLEAELFGIGRAVATGVDARPGLFVAADGGTIFLDEIGEMSPGLQPKLLRVLQEREVLPVGATKPRSIDVRVISSTNRDLSTLVAEGAFRADLYYRLRGTELQIPPLRARREDIPALALAFAQSAAAATKKRVRGISSKALTRLVEFEWPGNVRELRHAIEAAVARCPDGGSIQEVHIALPSRFSQSAPSLTAAASDGTLSDWMGSAERDAIVKAIQQCNGNKSRAAKLLGITRAGLYLKMKRHCIR